jgi:phenylacetic acid degradation operon negative regulatory protein
MACLVSFQKLLNEYKKQRPIRAGSLILSLFGDSISSHGNNVWLGSLISALEEFGLNQRLVRTSVYRLIQDGWLQSEQVGRRSFYSLSDYGLRHSAKAAERIYASGRPDWDGEWTLVILSGVGEEKEALRKELSWLGFGPLLNGMMAYPGNKNRLAVEQTLHEMKLSDNVILMDSRTSNESSARLLQNMAYANWGLADLANRYEEFLKRFRPVLKEVKSSSKFNDCCCFQVRTLLIHEYRRILLHDSDLPDELLPADWPGTSAYHLTANLYKAVHKQAERYLMDNFETANGALPPFQKSYNQRFGGLRS